MQVKKPFAELSSFRFKHIFKGGFNLGRILGTFEFEAMVYQELIPTLNKVSSKVKLGTTVPMVFVQDQKGQEALILDHMKQYGWRDAMNKKQGLDLDHIQMALEWLAKFHGLSHVLMQNQPDFLRKYKPINQRLDEATKSMMKNARQNLAGRLTKSVAFLETEENPKKYTDWITGLFAKNVVIDDLKDKMQTPTEFGFNAINHLDTWFNNMLFQYNEKNQVQEVLFLDFQGSGYCNVGNDLAMLLLSSTTKEFRDQNLKKVLMHYLKSLKDTVLKASNKDLKYSMADLEKDYRFGLPVGLTFCFNALPMILCEPEDVIDFSTVNFDDVKAQKTFVANASDSFNNILKTNANVQTRLRGILDDMIDAQIL